MAVRNDALRTGTLAARMAASMATQAQEFQINPGLNDAWFNPATDGQGFFFNVFPDQNFFFMSWFTYDTERPPEDITAILGEPGHRWLTASGSFDAGNMVVLDVNNTTGGLFDDPQEVTQNPGYGTITVTFENCNSATVDYDLPAAGVSGTIPVQRVVLDNVPLCETLAATE